MKVSNGTHTIRGELEEVYHMLDLERENSGVTLEAELFSFFLEIMKCFDFRAFHSSKLNAKMGRQLSDFLSVATQQIPKWTGDLIKAV